MKNHGQFTEELYEYLDKRQPSLGTTFNRETAASIVRLSRMGLAPEGKGTTELNAYVDRIYSMGSVPVALTEPPQPAPIPPPPIAGKYVLGNTSQGKLRSLFPPLAKVVELAITLSTQDFTVMEVMRTLERQKQLLAQGKSRTLKSKHLKQATGFAHAVDLGAFNGGLVTWGFEDYFEICQAMDAAATQLGVADHVRWGAVWDKVLSDFGGFRAQDYVKAVEEYKTRHAGSDFLDGPHFEWVA